MAKYLFSCHKGIERALRGRFLYLFLDYDGTLSPIAETPERAVMPARTRKLLERLSKAPDTKIAVISGRAVEDVSRRVGLKDIIYAGNHGFEIEGPKINFKSPVPVRYRKILEEIKGKLEKCLAAFDGVIIEDKGFSLSIHYRMVAKKDALEAKNSVYAAVLPYEVRENVKLKAGKKVLEIRPPIPWDKGKVVLWLLGRRIFAMGGRKKKILPVYIGDDRTDEDAFRALRGRGITVFVGKDGGTEAQFYVKDTRDVVSFLEKALEVVGKGRICRKKR